MSTSTPTLPSPPPASPQKILICGHRAFAAVGLPELLRARGHHVTTFSRGPVGRKGDDVTGPVEQMTGNPELAGPYDVVLNYILLKDDDIAKNNAFIDEILAFCASRRVPHYAHLSSVSVYAGRLGDIYEDSIVEEVPTRKGAYGSLKVATDLRLIEKAPAELRISFIRPGFILGKGLIDPTIGMALRSWWNELLVLGSTRNTLPVVTRDQVNQAIIRIIELSEKRGRESFLLLDPNSPSRREWLEGVCKELGAGNGTFAFPIWFLRLAGFGGGLLTKLVGMSVNPNKIVRNMCRVQRFHPEKTLQRLGMSFDCDWRTAVRESYDAQTPNFIIPFTTLEAPNPKLNKLTILGYGGIIRQKHRPALKTIGFTGTIDAYDIAARTDIDGTPVKAIAGASLGQTDLVVVASPGPAHVHAIATLATTDAPILVEKPLCYSQDEVNKWVDFAKGRKAGVFICHNFRFKPNVARMMKELAAHNPGELLHVDVLFQSPTISKEWRSWTRAERHARTLLMDYAVHHLDLACMFATEGWSLGDARHTVNNQNQTSLIEGKFKGPYTVQFLLRQGNIPRLARINYIFQNYNCQLAFFPDSYTVNFGGESPLIDRARGKQVFRGFREKVFDKLLKKDRDNSHPGAYLAATTSPELGRGIRVENLASLYSAVSQLGEAVYGPWRS